jgi:site-specific recombinase XerD
VEEHLRPDLDLLLARLPGDLYAEWISRHAGDVARIVEVAERFGWSANWTRDVSRGGLSLLCLTAGKGLDELTDDDFEAFARDLADAPSAGPQAWTHNSSRLFSLHQACYELRICQRPPRQARPGRATLEQRMRAIPQPRIRKVALRYLTTVAATLRPSTVELRADSLVTFTEYLATHHPAVHSLTQLTREHIEDFLAYNHRRPWRGRVARDRPVSPVVSKRTVIDLRCFFDDLAVWGWAERVPGRLLFASDIPRLDRPLPRALASDIDRDLMAAANKLPDPFARIGLTLLRGTGIRLGELLDLELDCVWDSASHGSWLKVPVGKLGTERTVPLDAATLCALDEWITLRGPQRALPHPRLQRPADFLFVERGRRLTAYRLRHGLDTAAAAAGLPGPDGQPLHVTPHQLRHTYATSLVNAGMSLQALMALLGHVSTEMTLRYASLAAPTVRAAYEEAMSKARTRLTLAIAPVGKPIVPNRVEWLRGEMLKTRVAHGYCSRQLAAQACPYANVCEQCDNFVTATEFIPALQDQIADLTALHDDAAERGWDTEVARHARVIASIQGHLDRLTRHADPGADA